MTTAQSMLENGVRLIDEGQLPDAFEVLAKALELEPTDPDILIQLARLSLAGAMPQEAANFLSEACLSQEGVEKVAALSTSFVENGSFTDAKFVQAALRASVADEASDFNNFVQRAHRQHILDMLIVVTERFPRDYDPNLGCLLKILHDFRDDRLEDFWRIWCVLVDDILRSPQWLSLLLPDMCRGHPELCEKARAAINSAYLPTELRPDNENISAWLSTQAEPANLDSLPQQLLSDLVSTDPSLGAPFLFLSRFYFFRDMLYGYFVDAKLAPVQHAIFRQCYLQRQNWQHSYAADYPYQGMARLGINGAKPAEERLRRYAIDEFLKPGHRVLDIGSNNGFLALQVAARVGHVRGVEFNPYLVDIAKTAAAFLDVKNVEFLVGDFVELANQPAAEYDSIFSLANHCTIDGNLSIDFEQYVAKIFTLLKPGGILFFESHNVFGPGAGGAGDDGDLDAKFSIVERYFEVVKYKMTETYVPAFDIDKLFVVLRRSDCYDRTAVRSLQLADARTRYAY